MSEKIEIYEEMKTLTTLIKQLEKENILKQNEIEKIKQELNELKNNHLINKTNIENLKEKIEQILLDQKENKKEILDSINNLNITTTKTTTTIKLYSKVLVTIFLVLPSIFKLGQYFYEYVNK